MERHQSSMDTLINSFIELSRLAPGMRTKIGILRSLYPHIKAAKQDGYTYGFILNKLIENDFKETKLNEFYGLLNRLRLGDRTPSSTERPVTNNQLISCGISENPLYSRKATNEGVNISPQSRSNAPTIEEMKLASRTFDIDPNAFD